MTLEDSPVNVQADTRLESQIEPIEVLAEQLELNIGVGSPCTDKQK